MKYLIIFLFTLVLSQPVLSQDLEFTSKYGYSLTLPAIWEQVPQDILTERTKQISEMMGQEINYDAAFVLKGNPPFTNPFILIQYINKNSGNFEDYVKAVESDKKIKELTDDLMEGALITEFDIDNIYIDRTNKIIFQNVTVQSGTVVIKGMSAMMLGGNEVVQVLFYDLDTDYNTNIEKFFTVLKSFNYSN